jgi:hypothetical protein
VFMWNPVPQLFSVVGLLIVNGIAFNTKKYVGAL